MLRHLEPPK